MRVNRGDKRPREVSAEAAASVVRSGDWLDYGITIGQPDVFDRALAARVSELREVKIRSCISVAPRAVIEADPGAEHVQFHSWHFSAYDRGQHDAGRCRYLPCNLGEIPDYYRRFLPPVDVAIVKTRPMDADGWFNFGPTQLWMRTVIERAQCVIVEVNEGLPHAFGETNGVHRSEVDFIIEGDGAAPAELPAPPRSPADEAVGRLIAAEIDDGACLQIGIGAMPNAVCASLLEAGVRDLGVHTEMLTDGIMALWRAGRITGRHKVLEPGRIGYGFALGSGPFYRMIDRNPDLYCMPVERTNLPHRILENPRTVSINNTTQIDLQGQAASESDGHRHLSGTGGQLQFVRGGYAAEGGKAFLCLSSVYERRGVRRSRIVLNLTPGNVVTTPRTDVMYVVTEFGMANLKGQSVAERARLLIGLAHPDFREELEREARAHGLLPRPITVGAR